ncbi:PAS domain-containing sensor histidine kinase [Thiohalorhabdus sp. Cl-TMA]|uniref:histidine kinase n=1 Tax=Thiohalorhabdus methylotrophus TaxID=3242694 RepID=A0ABV4TX39_9GAMM
MHMDSETDAQPRGEESGLFEQLFNRSPLPQLLMEPEQGGILRASPAACRLLGTPKSRVEGSLAGDLFPDAADRVADFLERAVRDTNASQRIRTGAYPPTPGVLELRGTVLHAAGQLHIHTALLDASREEELTRVLGFQESLMEHFPDAAFLKDHHGVYESCNQRFLEGLGKDIHEVVGARDHDLLPAHIADRCTATDREVLTEQRPRKTERWVRNTDGEWSLLELLKLPYRDTDGRLRGVIGLGRDITDHRHTEQRLQNSEHMLQEILGASPEGFWMGDFETLETVEVNSAFCRMLGRSREELLGARPDAWLDPEDREAFWEKANQRREHSTRHYEVRFLASDGHKVPVVANVSTYSDPDGRPAYSVAFITDVSRLRHTEKSLKRLADILEAFPGPVGICDADLNLLYHNHYAQEMLAPRDAGAASAESFFAEHSLREVLEEEALPTARREGLWTGQTVLLDKEGREIPFLLTLVAHFTREGSVERFSAIGVDISAQKEAEERERQYLEQLNRVSRLISMGELISILSHQLNQPLTSLNNYAAAGSQLLSNQGAMPSQLGEILEGVENEAQKASEILTQIRNFLKGQGPELQPLDLNRLILEIIPFICTGCTGTVPSILPELEEDLPRVEVDRVQIQEAIFNLARNGMESCMEQNPDSPGPLILTTRREGEYVEVTITDHGTGLPAGLELDALAPFFTTKEKGLGLGLWITRSIIQAHGGRLTARNNAEAEGATFQILLPVTEEPPSEESRE